MKQIGFIVGTGRCGTTILAQVLNSHSRICVPHELQIVLSIGNGDRLYEKYINGELKGYRADDFIRLIEKCCPYYFERYFDYISHFRNLSYPQSDIRKILTGLFDHICFDNKKEVFMEQTPWYGQRLDTLHELFPRMKVVHLIRDGRDVALSFMRTPWWPNDILQNLYRWNEEVNNICAFGLSHPEDYIELRYEDLVESPEKNLRAALKLINLEFEPGMLMSRNLIEYRAYLREDSLPYQSAEYIAWHKAKEKSVFFPGSKYSWKSYKDYDFVSIPDTIKETLVRFGYEA